MIYGLFHGISLYSPAPPAFRHLACCGHSQARMIPCNASLGHANDDSTCFEIDSTCVRLYIDTMAEDGNTMFEQELKRLEKRVDALVSVCDQLQDENKSLKQRQDTLTAERATLLQKNEQVRARVEAMIGRLKAMEQGG
jgi:cell division protein ZapB